MGPHGRIQDFPDGWFGGGGGGGGGGVGGQPLNLGEILFGKIFAKNCMKIRRIGPTRGWALALEPHVDLPMLRHMLSWECLNETSRRKITNLIAPKNEVLVAM